MELECDYAIFKYRRYFYRRACLRVGMYNVYMCILRNRFRDYSFTEEANTPVSYLIQSWWYNAEKFQGFQTKAEQFQTKWYWSIGHTRLTIRLNYCLNLPSRTFNIKTFTNHNLPQLREGSTHWNSKADAVHEIDIAMLYWSNKLTLKTSNEDRLATGSTVQVYRGGCTVDL